MSFLPSYPPESIDTLWLTMNANCLSLPAFSEQQHKWRERFRIGILAPTSYEMPNFICICTHMQLDVLFITYTLTSKRNLWKAKENSYYLLVFILGFENSLLNLILTSKCFPKPAYRSVAGVSQVVLVVKNLPANAGDGGEAASLGGEDPLE